MSKQSTKAAGAKAPAAGVNESHSGNVPRRRPNRAAFFVLPLLLIACLAWWLTGAWHATTLREAYLPDLEVMARRSPADGTLQALYGARLIEAGEFAAGAEALKRAVAAGDGDPQVWLNLAAATAATGDFRRAAADLQLAHDARPHALEFQAVAQRLQQQGKTADPRRIPLLICPDGPLPLVASHTRGSVLNGLAEWWGRTHPESSGFTTRMRWAERQPQNPEAARLWGLALARNRRYPEAGAALEHAAALAPNSAPVRLALADTQLRAGDARQASRSYLTALKLKPRWLPALLGYGQASMASGFILNAVSAYKLATETTPDSADAWIGFGRAQLQTGVDYPTAVAALEKALKLAPRRTDFLADYADALRLAGRLDEAERIARHHVAEAPDDAYGHYLLGHILLDASPSVEREAEAETETRDALRLSPHNPRATTQLATILQRHGKNSEALGLLRDAHRREPYNVARIRMLAQAEARAGGNAEARRLTAEADTLFAAQQRVTLLQHRESAEMTSISLHEELARLLERTGQRDGAQAERNIVELLRKNPKGAAAELERYRADQRDAFKNP